MPVEFRVVSRLRIVWLPDWIVYYIHPWKVLYFLAWSGYPLNLLGFPTCCEHGLNIHTAFWVAQSWKQGLLDFEPYPVLWYTQLMYKNPENSVFPSDVSG